MGRMFVKPRPPKRSQHINTTYRNIVGPAFASFSQTIVTFERNISQHCWASNMFGLFGHPVATCCYMLRHVEYRKSNKCACSGATLLHQPNLVPRVFVPIDQRSENESSGSNHFEITEFCPSVSLLQELSFSDRWSGGTKTLGTRLARTWPDDYNIMHVGKFDHFQI